MDIRRPRLGHRRPHRRPPRRYAVTHPRAQDANANKQRQLTSKQVALKGIHLFQKKRGGAPLALYRGSGRVAVAHQNIPYTIYHRRGLLSPLLVCAVSLSSSCVFAAGAAGRLPSVFYLMPLLFLPGGGLDLPPQILSRWSVSICSTTKKPPPTRGSGNNTR